MTICITARDDLPVPRPLIARVLCDVDGCGSEDEYEFRNPLLVPAMAEAKRLAKAQGWREYAAVGRGAPTHRCPGCAAPGQLSLLEEP